MFCLKEKKAKKKRFICIIRTSFDARKYIDRKSPRSRFFATVNILMRKLTDDETIEPVPPMMVSTMLSIVPGMSKLFMSSSYSEAKFSLVSISSCILNGMEFIKPAS